MPEFTNYDTDSKNVFIAKTLDRDGEVEVLQNMNPNREYEGQQEVFITREMVMHLIKVFGIKSEDITQANLIASITPKE